MKISEVISDKTFKGKEKTKKLSKMLLDKEFTTADLMEFAKSVKGSPRATCVEVLEYATKENPKIANEKCLQFAIEMLTDEAPRVKWEAAKVIGNIAPLFPTKLDKAVDHLLTNSEYPGTVVRWSAAFALSEIVKLNTKINKELLPAVDSILKREEEASIKKFYQKALKEIEKKK